jgi:phosphatidylserine/phosphatidylglycerophosphate/cardiolipin synthase-like enzyme
MRVLKRNADDSFRVKAYAGTNGVLLAFDLSERPPRDFLGFAIRRKDASGRWQWLLNSLTFPGRAHTLPDWGATPSDRAPLQKFRWADYTVEPGTTCTYQVYLACGSPDSIELREPLTVTIKTDDGSPSDHHVIFNRAVAASQAFGRKFKEWDKALSAKPRTPIEEWPDAPRKWLEHGLLDRILAFLKRARNDTWALDVAIYEYELEAIVDAIKQAHQRGVKVRVIYHGKAGDEQTEQNEESLRGLPKSCKKARATSRIFHHKFIVLSKRAASGEYRPSAVLCGSTNFTENGVYRQANVVHVAEDTETPAKYRALFDEIWKSPADVKLTKAWISQNNPIEEGGALYCGFSPRKGGGDLAEFVRIINGARRDLLFATAFKLTEDILDALLGDNDDPILRYGLQNSASRITGYHADRTAEFTTPALLTKGLEGWVKEGLRGQRGNLLVHLKAVVVDFTSDHPVVISGSHNLSKAASDGNDENFLIIRGDRDLADRYGLEILRFYEHYRFRYYAKLLALKKAQPLAEDSRWVDAYYRIGTLKHAGRLRYAGR